MTSRFDSKTLEFRPSEFGDKRSFIGNSFASKQFSGMNGVNTSGISPILKSSKRVLPPIENGKYQKELGEFHEFNKENYKAVRANTGAALTESKNQIKNSHNSTLNDKNMKFYGHNSEDIEDVSALFKG
jgi:hypothetical protein